MSLPLFKLGALLVKQLSKPVGKAIKEKAQSNETLKRIVIPVAKVYHHADMTVRMRILGLGAPDTVPALTDSKAIEIGGDLLAEFVVFGTAIAIIMIEYIRSASKAANKEISDDKKVEILQFEQKHLIEKLDKATDLITKLENSVKEQKKKTEDLSKKYDKLTEKSKSVNKGNQTTEGRQVGKIIIPSKILKTASQDVRNDIVYQCAEEAVNEIRFYGRKPYSVDKSTK